MWQCPINYNIYIISVFLNNFYSTLLLDFQKSHRFPTTK